MFTLIALSLFKILDNINTPCSVNTKGSFRRPPQLDVAICDFKLANSSQDIGILINSSNILGRSLSAAATVYPQIQMSRAYGSQRGDDDYRCGRNKFHPYKMNQAYGFYMLIPKG